VLVLRNCAVTVSSTGAENQFQADDNGHVGRPCEVSLAPPYPELFASYGASESFFERANFLFFCFSASPRPPQVSRDSRLVNRMLPPQCRVALSRSIFFGAGLVAL
jgi:hypothetical protein